ncbi:uncharacterized protein [Pyxicephalus adspersus]|uniref:uncharacterized protein n=1 Tax=Pyxicephalus adspersus TaxID=30357 RepID=UPI003B5A1076
MALQWAEADLPLSLDDFIPRHLQKKDRSNHNYTEDQVISDDDNAVYKARLVFTSEDSRDSPSPRTQRRWIRYEGIGPTDEDGMPFASRSSVDRPRDWYRNMFRVLHPLSDPEDSDSDSKGSIQIKQRSQTHNVKTVSGYRNKEQHNKPDLDEQSRKNKETSHLHIALKSTVNETPTRLISTSKVQTSVGPSSLSLNSTGPSHFLSSEEQRSPPSRSEEPQFTRRSMNTYTSTISTSTQTNHNLKRLQTPEPTLPNSVPLRPYHTLQMSDIPRTPSLYTSKEMSSPKSPNERDKYSSFRTNSSISTLSPTSRERRKSATKVLDQLESELREFTKELDRDLEARKRTDSLEQ